MKKEDGIRPNEEGRGKEYGGSSERGVSSGVPFAIPRFSSNLVIFREFRTSASKNARWKEARREGVEARRLLVMDAAKQT